ncbi:recombination-associated protein RdgC [Desulfogranum marinum]|uniref:recombination-associated protein RdgC n=1 Tax=Desulfogranum marinum TaxID=453220 RepID=UPI0019646285|nr:recombination-associated protein RdgC [Desulfogranum marinum]MBM9513063.1 recombination-associated protein RdgC [Desulfogranum marinum]
MGLISGAASFTRFSVVGELPDHFWDFVADRVAANSFRDIDDTIDEYSIGWVSVADMFDADFAYSSYAAGDYVVLTMRTDERKVSPAVLKKYTMKEEARIKREKEIPRLSRAARLEIKERIRAELIRKSAPIPATYDLCWNLSENTLLFFSTSKKAIALLEDLFKETFAMSLILQIPWLTGLDMINEDATENYEAMRPAVLL